MPPAPSNRTYHRRSIWLAVLGLAAIACAFAFTKSRSSPEERGHGHDHGEGVLARRLAGVSGAQRLEAVFAAANDPEPRIRAAAVEELSEFSDPRVAEKLDQAFRDSASIVREKALYH